jgi:hypothetical protein
VPVGLTYGDGQPLAAPRGISKAISSERGLDLVWIREVLKTSIRVLRSVPVTGREGFKGNRNQQNSFSTMEHGKVEIGAKILPRISREFGNSIEWLLTGKGQRFESG